MAEMTIEEAVAVLNSRKWRDRDDWQTVTWGDDNPKSYAVSAESASQDWSGHTHRLSYLSAEAIAIATGLVAQDELKAAQERIGGLEQDLALLLKQHPIQTIRQLEAELEQLRAALEASKPADRDDAELGRWQDAIRSIVIKLSGAPDSAIEGAGCDSGDPLDLTLAEITQGFAFVEESKPAEGTWRELILKARAAITCTSHGNGRGSVEIWFARLKDAQEVQLSMVKALAPPATEPKKES